MRLLTHDDLIAKGVTFKRTHLRKLEDAGKFPRRVCLGPKRHGYVESEIDQWLADRIAERDCAA